MIPLNNVERWTVLQQQLATALKCIYLPKSTMRECGKFMDYSLVLFLKYKILKL